jgi:hypothetical protein
LWTKWHWYFSNYFGSRASIIPPLLHTHLLLSEGPAREAWGSSNKATLFQKLGVLDREVLSFFSDFREFKELGMCNFFTSDHISLKVIGFCD